MKQPTVVRDFSELKYLIKAGHPPVKKDKPKERHTGNWIVCYGKRVLDYNLPYPIAVTRMKEYKMKGIEFPDKTKFSIKPYTL